MKQTKIFEAATAAELETLVNNYMATGAENVIETSYCAFLNASNVVVYSALLVSIK